MWGHGSNLVPDWTADWLNREATYLLNHWALKEFGHEYGQLTSEQQAQL